MSSTPHRVGAVAPVPVPQVVSQQPYQQTGGCGAYTPVIAPQAVPLYPPIFPIRRPLRPAGISVGIAPGQTTSGMVALMGVNFVNGDIALSGNSIQIRRSARYTVDLSINVSFSGAGSAFFQTVPGFGTYLAGGTVTAAGTQVYTGSVVLDLTRGSTVSLTSVLSSATIVGGVLSVQMVPGTDVRLRDGGAGGFEEEFFDF
jgi:hypothetical protein